MSYLKSILADLSNGFQWSDFPLLFFQIFAVILMASLILKFSFYDKETKLMIITFASVLTFLVQMSKQSIYLSILTSSVCISLAILLSKYLTKLDEVFRIIVIFMISLACGFGFVIPCMAVFLVIILPLFYLSKNLK